MFLSQRCWWSVPAPLQPLIPTFVFNIQFIFLLMCCFGAKLRVLKHPRMRFKQEQFYFFNEVMRFNVALISHSSKHLIPCPREERKSYRFGTFTYGFGSTWCFWKWIIWEGNVGRSGDLSSPGARVYMIFPRELTGKEKVNV